MNFARRSRLDVGVDLTPMIDVVFLLLIFFMVSTTFIREQRLTIDLPESSEVPAEPVEHRVEIVVSATGAYAVNGVPLVDNEGSTLRSAINNVAKGDRTLPLIITADGSAPHRAVVTVLDAAAQLGFNRLSITTRKPPDDEQN
ncbi:MAG: biopolymer transporter ExbD [Pseudomonadales bacterium]